MMTLTAAKVRTLAESEKTGAKELEKLKAHPHKTLITILIGSNLVNIFAASLTTVVMTNYFGSAGVGIATGILTIVVLVFGEVLPKSFATTHATPMALVLAKPLYLLSILFTPIIFLLDILVNFFLKLFGGKYDNKVTDQELLALASIGAEEGSIMEHERELIENVLEFDDLKVEDVMTPRVHIDAVPVDFTLHEAAQYVIHHTHSRIPVYRETLDNIVGILSVKELLKNIQEEEDEELTLRQMELMTPLKVSHRSTVQNLFRQFKMEKTHMAIVLDEHGGTAGIATMEDLLEELVGDIEDEEDEEEEWVVDKGDGSYALSPRLALEDLEEVTGLKLNYPENKTLSYLLVDKLGALPKVGNKVQIGKWEFEIVQMWRHTILKVLARMVPNPSDAPSPESRSL